MCKNFNEIALAEHIAFDRQSGPILRGNFQLANWHEHAQLFTLATFGVVRETF